MSRFTKKIETILQPTKLVRPSRFKKVIAIESEPSVPNGSPRMPSVEVCGHKPYNLFTCGLPKGHTGACSEVELPEVDAKIVRRMQTSCPITLTFDKGTIPQELTDILYAWKKTGNNWGSGLETELLVFSKGLKFEHKADNPYAIGCLVFLGYMEALPPNPHERLSVRKYRLSKKGLEAAAEIARRIGDTQIDPMTSTVIEMDKEVDCAGCNGSGVDEDGDRCTNCKGTGTVIERPSYRGTKIREEIKSITQHQKIMAKPQESKPIGLIMGIRNRKRIVEVDCRYCSGTGVTSRGTKCNRCGGSGTVEIEK